MSTLTATFPDRASADRAVHDLLAFGVSPEDVSLMVSNSTRERYFKDQDGGMDANTARGAAIGGGIGAIAGGLVLGGVITAATGGAALPFLAAGSIAAAASGAIGGTAIGTVVGGLAGASTSEPVAETPGDGIRQGALVVSVRVIDEASSARLDAILNQHSERVAADGDTAVPPTPEPGQSVEQHQT